MPRLRELIVKVRGLLGLGAIGGVAGLVGGALWAAAQNLLGLGFPSVADIVGLATGGGISGAACGVGFGLATLESKSSLADLSLRRLGLPGAALGALLPTLYLLVTSGTVRFLNAPLTVLTLLGSGSVLGGLLSSTMVGPAKRVHGAEMAAVEEVAALLEAE